MAFTLQSDPYGDHVLIVEGEARVDRDALPSDRHPAYAAKFRDALAHWGLEVAQTARDFSVAVRITPVTHPLLVAAAVRREPAAGPARSAPAASRGPRSRTPR